MNTSGFFEALSANPFLSRALIAGVLAGACCALLSPFVVLRRMAFIGDGMAHATFGGIGLGLFLFSGSRGDELHVQAVTLAFCIVLGIGIGRVSRNAGEKMLSEDSAIGIAFSVSMALGALLLKLRQQSSPQYVPSMEPFLFGSILSISTNDLWLLAGLLTLLALLLIVFQKELLFYTYDARLAEVSGINVRLLHYLLILGLVLTVVLCARVVGVVLVSASLILPGVIALKVCHRLLPALLLSAVVGIVCFTGGLYISYWRDIPPGSSVVLLQFILLLAAMAYERLRTQEAAVVPTK